MRVLDLHAEHLEFAVTTGPLPEDAAAPEQPTDDASDDTGAPGEGPTDPPEGVPVPREGRLEDCLAAFVAVEGVDAAGPDAVAERAAAHLRERAADLRVDAVAVYPFAHLTDTPADRETAVACCRALGAALARDPDGAATADGPATLDVLRAPVGWHRRFAVRTTGHPFAEATARFRPGDGPGAGVPSRTDPTAWRVHTPDGERPSGPESTTVLDDDARAVLRALTDGDGEPPDEQGAEAAETHPTEPLTEPDGLGGRRVLPAGRLVGDLVEDLVRERALDAGAAPVETPLAYDLTDPAVARLAGTLGDEWVGSAGTSAEHEGSGSTGSDGSTVRPSTRLGFRSLLADSAPDPAALPLRAFESGVVRSRDDPEAGNATTTVPAIHVATADAAGGWSELVALASLATDCLDALGLAAVPVCRAGPGVRADRLDGLAAALDRPLLFTETNREGLSIALRGVRDGAPTPVTARLRLDPAPALDALPDGGVCCHCEPVGDLDAVRRALAGVDPLPAWLAPTTVRFVPVESKHREHAETLTNRVEAADGRADVDARALPVGERLDAARAPFLAVVGDRERDGGPVKLLDRREGIERRLSVEELVAFVERAVGDRPRRPRYRPLSVSEWPFRGA